MNLKKIDNWVSLSFPKSSSSLSLYFFSLILNSLACGEMDQINGGRGHATQGFAHRLPSKRERVESKAKTRVDPRDRDEAHSTYPPPHFCTTSSHYQKWFFFLILIFIIYTPWIRWEKIHD